MKNNNSRSNPLKSSVLVLNRLYMPVRVVDGKRAIILLYKDKAEVITVSEDQYLNYSFDTWLDKSNNGGIQSLDQVEYVKTPNIRIALPRVIRLYSYDGFQKGNVRFNRKNIFARDGYTCQYCGERKSENDLSLDHVVPRSRGGKSSWQNIVTACKSCNVRKGGRLLKNTDMELNKTPNAPSTNPVVKKHADMDKYSCWNVFLENASTVVKIN